MAAAADSSSAYSAGFRPHNVASPWSHVVRGEREALLAPGSPPSLTPAEPSEQSLSGTAASGDPADAAGAAAAAAALAPPSDGVEQGGGIGDASAPAREKRSAWSRPANGAVEVGAVMGAVSWPALSEATKAPPKSSSNDSPKGLYNGSVPAPPAPVTTSPPPMSASSDANSGSSANRVAPIRPKSMKRGGGSSADSLIINTSGGALANGGQMLPKMQITPAEVSHGTLDKLVNSEPSPRELTSRSGGNWDRGYRVGGLSPQSHGGNEHHKNYGGSRRGNHSGGGGGHHHNNFGNRPDQERGSYDWNHRHFGRGRDMQGQQQQQQPRAITRPFIRPPPPGSAPFVAPPPPVRPFANHIGYHDIASPFFYVPPPPPESLRGMPFVAPPAMFFAPSDLQLRATLLKQVDYYFSPENLCKDVYLRQNMDEEGWVPISLIAGFNRVRNLTNNIQFILDTVRASTIVEVQGDKVRRRNDWKNWPLLTPAPNPPSSSTKPNYDALATRLTNIRMEEAPTGQILSRSSSGDFNSQSQMVAFSADRSAQSIIQNGSDPAVSARSLSRSDTF